MQEKFVENIIRIEAVKTNTQPITKAIYKMPEGDVVETDITHAKPSHDKKMTTLRLCDGTTAMVSNLDLVNYKHQQTELPGNEYQSHITMHMPDGTLTYVLGNYMDLSLYHVWKHDEIQISSMFRVRTMTREY